MANSTTTSPRIERRRVNLKACDLSEDTHPVLHRIYAARQVATAADIDRSLAALPPVDQLRGMQAAVDLLVEAIDNAWRILIVADYDADGATSCALLMRGLPLLGATHVEYLIPNRFEYGYGLTPEIVEVAMARQPDLIVTVDNGISSVDGVAAAKAAGCRVLITDHHLPGSTTPAADVIVNPNQLGDDFPSKALAGVGVAFYVLLALRAHLRAQGRFGDSVPNLAELLDLVALGTVADVVPLDVVNRKLVHQGLMRMRAGRCCPGILALLQVAGREPARVVSSDMGFAVGPRLNAAGRLEDMSLGIECLLTTSAEAALDMAQQLDSLNRERRTLESDMQVDALKHLNQISQSAAIQSQWGVCLYDSQWHQGVIGILASRIKERLHRPVIVFSCNAPGELKGSARSIEGLHIRDVLDDIAAKHPALLNKFGGHAMAAGLSLRESDLPAFQLAFDEAVKHRLNDSPPEKVIIVDGELSEADFNLEFAQLLQQAGPWGQGFPEPLFEGQFRVLQVRVLQNKHLKMVLQAESGGRSIDAIAFNVEQPQQWVGCQTLRCAYRLDINVYQNRTTLQLMIQHLESVS